MQIATISPLRSAILLSPSGALVQSRLHWPCLILLNGSTPPISLMPALQALKGGGWGAGLTGISGEACRHRAWGKDTDVQRIQLQIEMVDLLSSFPQDEKGDGWVVDRGNLSIHAPEGPSGSSRSEGVLASLRRWWWAMCVLFGDSSEWQGWWDGEAGSCCLDYVSYEMRRARGSKCKQHREQLELDGWVFIRWELWDGLTACTWLSARGEYFPGRYLATMYHAIQSVPLLICLTFRNNTSKTHSLILPPVANGYLATVANSRVIWWF